jgi:hypothetical protein
MENNASKGGRLGGVLGVVLLILAAVGLYYFYQFMFRSGDMTKQTIIDSPIPANKDTRPARFSIPPIVEGGEYSVSFWTYISGWASRRGMLKHILEIRGRRNFSTLLVGLGGFNNSLVVRVSSQQPTSGGMPVSGQGSAGASSLEPVLLTPAYVDNLFGNIVPDQGILSTQTLCDLPLVDMQRWVCISVVLNGRTVDVYMDGKLARSCVLPSFYRVDSAGSDMQLLRYGGYEGFLSGVNSYDYALNPEQVYRIYMSGPNAGGDGFMGWLRGLFDVQGSITYKEPSIGVKYTERTVEF